MKWGTCCIPWEGKLKYQVTNVGIKRKIVTLGTSVLCIIDFMSQTQHKTPQ